MFAALPASDHTSLSSDSVSHAAESRLVQGNDVTSPRDPPLQTSKKEYRKSMKTRNL